MTRYELLRASACVAAIIFHCAGSSSMCQQAPQVVNYQGRLVKTNGATYPNGTVQVRVKLMSSPLAGATLWNSGLRSVQVQSGVFSMALQGGTPPFSRSVFDQGLTWFEVSVIDGQSVERVLLPRQMVTVAPWAFWAETVSSGAIKAAQMAADPSVFDKISEGVVTVETGTNAALRATRLRSASLYLDNTPFASIDLSPGGTYGSRIRTDGFNMLKIESDCRVDGKLGIGLSTPPTDALDVSGNIHLTNGLMTFDGGPNSTTVLNGANGQFRIDAEAQIVIGSPNQPSSSVVIGSPGAPNGMYVHGTVDAGGFFSHSSVRFKTDVAPIENALERLLKLRGVQYKWKPQFGGKSDIGFLAEDVQKVFPEVVSREKDTDLISGIDYGHLSAVAVEAIKEQQVRLEKLERENKHLKTQVGEQDRAIKRLEQRLNQIERRH